MPDSRPSPDEWVEAGQIADESLGRPARRTPEEGVKEMEARIAHLKTRKNIAAARRECAPYLSAERRHWSREIRTLNTELREAQDRLAEYQAQLKGRN